MGTEFEDKAYIPGYYDMEDSIVNSNGNVSPYYEDKKSTLHHSDQFTIVSANGSVQYDKEMLKRTMLVHEATFRRQVFELHRLYKIQKDLMAQFQGEDHLFKPISSQQSTLSVFCSSFSDPNTSTAWLQHKQNGTNSSFGQYLSGNSSLNHLIFTPPLFNHTPNSRWQSKNTSHYGISLGSTNTPYHRPKIHGKTQDWNPPPHHNIMKDLDLNDVPVDTLDTWQEGSDSSLVDTSAFSEKSFNQMKSQVQPIGANVLSQTFVSTTMYSGNGTITRITNFTSNASAEKDSPCSPTIECGINISTSIKSEADKEMQPQSENAGLSSRNLFDLNEALPIMDDLEVDACEPEGVIASQEPNDPSRDSLAITAAENLVAMGNDGIQRRSPQLDTLHWFADLATSKENNDNADDFEALTLKLEETKSCEFFSAPRTHECDSNDGHCSATSFLVTRPRGKARGRPPKKKDFQKDILPSLGSLPEKEVSEDLCLLGMSNPVTPEKQRGRNGKQTRGRRRPRTVAAVVAMEETEISPPSVPPPPPLVLADLAPDVLRVTRWGRTTRRCRRPRCLPVNNASLNVA